MRVVYAVLYAVVMYLLLPVVYGYLYYRSWRSDRRYRDHLSERFSCAALPPHPVDIWLHVASVGELHAVLPLVRQWAERSPHDRWLITCMTPTGRARAEQLLGDLVLHVRYLPWDLPCLMRRLVRRCTPKMALVMEVELWPHWLYALRHAGVPVFLLNARLSEHRFRFYRRFAPFVYPVLSLFQQVLVSASADHDRFRALGLDRTTMVGNMKFDVSVDTRLQALGLSWRAACAGREIVLCASSHAGEEEAFVQEARRRYACAEQLLVIVPRHPDRTSSICAWLSSEGVSYALRSTGCLPRLTDDVWIGDSLGEMMAYYTMADYAIMGGTFMPIGGHNFIEALGCGLPVVSGPHTEHCAEEMRVACAAGAIVQVEHWSAAWAQIDEWREHPDQVSVVQQAAVSFIQSSQGAISRTMAVLWPVMSAQRAPRTTEIRA